MQRPLGIANRQRRARPRREDIRRLLDHLLDGEGEPRGVSVALVGDRAIRRLNRTWMDEDRVTDVLSFPMGDPPPGIPAASVPAGEVVVCVPVCRIAARDRGRPLHEEVARMLIHGALHILGHDHGTPRERARMAPRERRYLGWYRRRGLRVIDPA